MPRTISELSNIDLFQYVKKQLGYDSSVGTAIAEVEEIYTGNNYIKDGLMNGNETLYDIYVAELFACAGQVISIGVAAQPHQNVVSKDDKIKDITKNPENWELVDKESTQATAHNHSGGISYQEIYRNYETGDFIYRHYIVEENGVMNYDHYRDYWDLQ